MASVLIVCARCTAESPRANRLCDVCGLPLGTPAPDADAAADALGTYEPPGAIDPDVERTIRDFVRRSGIEHKPARHGWRLTVPLPRGRKQAVYVGYAGCDTEGRPILAVVSVCGPANDRDARTVLKFNAVSVDLHFAIKVLRGEEYFVVIRNLTMDDAGRLDSTLFIRRVAEAADLFEQRLTRGLDLY